MNELEPRFVRCTFSEDTLVSIEEGLMSIDQLDVGDYVLAYDEETGEIAFYPVTAVMVHEDPVIVLLTIDGEVIETTPEHPFYTTEGEWVPAGALLAGDEVLTAGGRFGIVQAVELARRPQLMYNLTVAEAHTFFVGDGQWLVHNDCGDLVPPYLQKWYKQMQRLSRKEKLKQLKTLEKTLEEHVQKYKDVLEQGGRSVEVERLQLQVQMLKRMLGLEEG